MNRTDSSGIAQIIRQLSWTTLAWHASRCHARVRRGALRRIDGTLSEAGFARRVRLHQLFRAEYDRRKRSVAIREAWARKYGKFGL